MRIGRRQPQEKRLVGRTLPQGRQPAVGPAFGDQVKLALGGRAQMPFAGCGGPIAGRVQQLGHHRLLGRQWPVQLLGARIVRLAAGENAGPAGAARTACKERASVNLSPSRKAIQVRRTHLRPAVRSAIVPAEVVGDEDYDVRPLGCRQQTGRKKNHNGDNPP